MPPSKFSQSGAGGASSPHSTQLCRVFQALMLLLAEDASALTRGLLAWKFGGGGE